MNNNKFTYDKFKSAKFGFSIIKRVYFLDKHRR